ncbi:prolyl oligopeptidase family serine peptidase [Carboxylicivirga caseinilyticus]|uniref:S9 family peptidase n=1 Tax=Carboxylicivirga caseinilyticus TaxID=3417572 RepID=UPI003D34512A|nr:prolyl oligopeptidase family serine peptidase [Marinilabiliaceae bacterium A049]
MKHLLYFVLLALLCQVTKAQVDTTDYQRAEQFLSTNLSKKYYNYWVSPNWVNEQNVFWYRNNTQKGVEYIKINLKTLKKEPLFNQVELAKQLSKLSEKEIYPYKLPVWIKGITNKNGLINFSYKDKDYTFDNATYSIQEAEKKEKQPSNYSQSPDKKHTLAFIDYNIWIKKDTNDSIQLTSDGTQQYGYGVTPSWMSLKNIESKEDHLLDLDINWSPNSQYAIIARYNRTNARNLYLYKTLPDKGNRAEVYSYERPLAGDSLTATVEYYIYNAEQSNIQKLDFEPMATFLSLNFRWNNKGTKAYLLRYYRGYQMMDISEVNTTDNSIKTVYKETAATYVDPNIFDYRILDDGSLILLSEKDGWNHLYRYDLESGKLLNQITKGDFVVRSIEHIDTKSKTIWFTAGGKEENTDPYLKLLYSAKFNGQSLKLLTPEKAEHSISISADNQLFVDNYSTVQEPNIAVLRSLKDGKVLKTIEQGDISEILKMGWQAPEPFKAKGRDGKTDIYGVIYKPAHFDPSKSYPIIEGTYSGPQTIRAPKSFRRGLLNDDTPLAQLGFVLINIDGMGSAYRSKAFHDVSYKNLGDIGGPDKMAVIKSLAKRYSWLDTTRVGIFGHSAGGYDAARALLAYPDFYKVGVAAAGNHDHRSAKAWWPEVYMGYPEGPHYDEQSNYYNADKLEGHLLLIHGDMDQNVNTTASMRFAAELIKANKDFDLLIVPGKDHSTTYYDKYVIRKRWDYFVRYLMGVEPPKNYKIK